MKATYSVAAILSTSFVLLIFGGGCLEGRQERSPEPQQGNSGPGVCSGAIVETMNSGGYTYVKVDCGGRLVWAAGPATEVAVGDKVSMSLGVEMRDFSSIDKPEGAKTIAEIFSSRAELTGVEILVLGKVVKFSPRIMGKNWIHIQDGAGEPVPTI